MKLFFRRLGAYLIDIIIVSIITALLSSVRFLNYSLDKYQKVYDNYIELYEKYEDDKISQKDFNKKIKDIQYQLDKYSVNTTIISIACLIGYFAIFQYSQNGRTIGKRIFKLQTVKYKNGKLNIGNYLLRSLILNNVIFSVASVVCVTVLSKKDYYVYNNFVLNVQAIVQLVIIVSMIMSANGRGIHDLIAGTEVKDLKEKDEFEENKNKKIIDGEIIK